jgi:5-methylcytosine-specific restriction endonuclease McrA
MNQYIKDFFHVIRNCSVENTYKMSWSKSIVECCVENPSQNVISFKDISHNVFKYYWDQTIHFDLQQSPNPNPKPKSPNPNPNPPPSYITYVIEEITKYQKKYGKKPVMFLRVQDKIELDYKRMVRILKSNVCSRFLKVDGKEYNLYELDKKNSTITVHHPEQLKEYSDFLFESINYRWTQILENFNHSPRISKKVKIIDLQEIKRGSLGKFRKYLDLMGTKCFICEKEIENETPSIDHVIPWSYMYSNDIWNLVNTHRSCNSSKSNILVKEETINKLEKRNVKLLKLLSNKGIEDKQKNELKLSIDRNLVKSFWNGFNG